MKKRKKEIRVYFCPKCNSHNVRFIFTAKNLLGIIPRMKCFDCQNEGSFPILVMEKERLEEKNREISEKNGRG